MIPLTILYDDYIDRRKLTEQKKPFEYIVPPPLKWVGTKMTNNWFQVTGDTHFGEQILSNDITVVLEKKYLTDAS